MEKKIVPKSAASSPKKFCLCFSLLLCSYIAFLSLFAKFSFSSSSVLPQPFRQPQQRTHHIKVSRSSESQSIITCRIYDVCMHVSGKYFIDYGLKQHHESVLKQCKMPEFEFHPNSAIKSLPNYDYHLYDISSTDPHIPHFVRHFITIPYAAFQITAKNNNNNNGNKTCYNLDSETVVRCPIDNEEEKKAIHLSHRFMVLDPSHWSLQLLQLLNGKHHSSALFLFSTKTLFSNHSSHHSEVMCFKSLTTTSFTSGSSTKNIFTDDHPFFHKNNIKRSMNTRLPSNLNIIYITRSNGERHLQNHPISFSIPHVSLSVSIHSFENASFSTQMSVMQSADIIIAAHGAALANVVFARSQTYLLEVVPFFHVRSPFILLSKSFDLVYETYVAQPDDQAFVNCVRHEQFEKKYEENVLGIWEKMKNGSLENVDSQNGGLFDGSDKISAKVRVCARKQNLTVVEWEIKQWVERTVKTIRERRAERRAR